MTTTANHHPHNTEWQPGTDQHRAERSLRLSLAAYAVLLAAKLLAYIATDVLAMLAEALHTVSDIFIAGFLLLALHWSRHPLMNAIHSATAGAGRGGLVAATLFISFTALRLYEEAIPRLFDPPSPPADVTLAVWVLGGSMVVVAAPLIDLARHRTRGPAAKALLWELINDELGLAAALIGTLLLLSGIAVADPSPP